ncbi:hypothetical protein [Polyangium mundeleinium]|uniref:EF-hand domain-containing protein n=1 Tax=Polyangium mundeleinium TaxID=2995306 RepID=A0ABT5EV82_9BACT|nr:hypothetical protein [Polyangium mundeleinium]MDC0744671.1 hypothetical protein [Polyangium mundeleinium]
MGLVATRLTASLGLTLGLGFVFLPLGCGSGPLGNPRPRAHGSGDGPSVPAATVAALSACAEHGAARLTDTHYAIMFDVDVRADGRVDKAKVRESMIDDREIVSCMEDALRGMSLPGVVTPLRAAGPVYGGSVSPEGRTPLGHPAAAVAGAAVNLIPIVLVAAGVTIVVAVTAHVVEEAVEAIEKWPKEVEDKCYPRLYECLNNTSQPWWNRRRFGDRKECNACFRECLKDSGEWPMYKCPPPGYFPN